MKYMQAALSTRFHEHFMLIYEFIVMNKVIVMDIYELIVMNKVSHSYLTSSLFILLWFSGEIREL